MQPKHTPGQWAVETYDKERFIYADGAAIVCQIETHFRTPEEIEANERLMCAAPRMLEYLIKRAEYGDREARAILSEIIPSIVWP